MAFLVTDLYMNRHEAFHENFHDNDPICSNYPLTKMNLCFTSKAEPSSYVFILRNAGSHELYILTFTSIFTTSVPFLAKSCLFL